MLFGDIAIFVSLKPGFVTFLSIERTILSHVSLHLCFLEYRKSIYRNG